MAKLLGWNRQKNILLLIMVHNVVMYISFCLVKKLVLLTVYLKLNRLQKNSDSLVTWHMPGTLDDFSYLS